MLTTCISVKLLLLQLTTFIRVKYLYHSVVTTCTRVNYFVTVNYTSLELSELTTVLAPELTIFVTVTFFH